jgi:hypothetical protein
MHCKIPVFLAYSMLIYIMASIAYLIITIPYGTPFKDALNKYPELQKIKKESANKRRNAFLIGLAIGIAFVVLFKPFSNCSKLF